MSPTPSPPNHRRTDDPDVPDAPLPAVRFHELSGNSNEVLIEHDGQLYRLRLTKNGKLLLNK